MTRLSQRELTERCEQRGINLVLEQHPVKFWADGGVAVSRIAIQAEDVGRSLRIEDNGITGTDKAEAFFGLVWSLIDQTFRGPGRRAPIVEEL